MDWSWKYKSGDKAICKEEWRDDVMVMGENEINKKRERRFKFVGRVDRGKKLRIDIALLSFFLLQEQL